MATCLPQALALWGVLRGRKHIVCIRSAELDAGYLQQPRLKLDMKKDFLSPKQKCNNLRVQGEEAGVKILKFRRTDQPGWGGGGVRPVDCPLILWLSKPVDRNDNK